MNPTIISALWITLIGMGLVFLALLVLWGLMALLVRVTARQAEAEAAEAAGAADEEEAAAPVEEAPVQPEITLLRRRAAVAAVAAVLALQGKKSGARPALPAAEPFSAWQSVLRANRLNQHSKMFTRK